MQNESVNLWQLYDPRPGYVWLESKSDPRWNVTIHVPNIVFTAGMPVDLVALYETKKQDYGMPPDDLMWGGMKD